MFRISKWTAAALLGAASMLAMPSPAAFADASTITVVDGIDVWKDAFVLSFNPQTPDRIDGYIPLAVIRGLHTLGLVGDVQ